jgi:hypothetical protein
LVVIAALDSSAAGFSEGFDCVLAAGAPAGACCVWAKLDATKPPHVNATAAAPPKMMDLNIMQILPGWPQQGLYSARQDVELTRPCEQRFLKLHACDSKRRTSHAFARCARARNGFSNYAVRRQCARAICTSQSLQRDPRAECYLLDRKIARPSSCFFPPFSIHVRFSLDAREMELER